VADFNARNVAESWENTIVVSVFVVNNKRAFSLHMAPISGFTMTRSEFAGGLYSFDIIISMYKSE